MRRAWLLVAAFVAGFVPALAQQDPNTRWHDSAELSYVVTAGNSDTQTFGFKNKLWRAWGKSALEFNLGGVRAEATTTTRFFVEDPNTTERDLVEDEKTDLMAEAYYFTGRYDRKISEKFFWYGGAGWDRNRFAGIDNRYMGFVGLGNIWVDKEKVKFRSDYAATYTKQDDVVSDPAFDDSFVGIRVSWGYLYKFGASTTCINDLIVDDNLEDTSDLRANMINAVSVSMTTHLALKVGLQLLYDHQPAFKEVDVFDAPPPPDGTGTKIDTELFELDKLDTLFTTSLVINF